MLSYDTATNMWGAHGQPIVIMQNETIKKWYAVAEGEDSRPNCTRKNSLCMVSRWNNME